MGVGVLVGARVREEIPNRCLKDMSVGLDRLTVIPLDVGAADDFVVEAKADAGFDVEEGVTIPLRVDEGFAGLVTVALRPPPDGTITVTIAVAPPSDPSSSPP